MTHKRALGLSLALLVTLTLGGCGDSTGGNNSATGDGAERVAHTYESRGIVQKLPGESPDAQLMIQHEPLPDFKNSAGKVVGMNSMTMPFPPADDVSVENLAVGDKVRFTFEVQWEPSAGWTLTAVEKLPADTTLNFNDAATKPDEAPSDEAPRNATQPASE